MPVTKELIGADALAELTGKTFSLEGVGTGNPVTLIPSPGPDGALAGHKIILSKGTAIEGITAKTAATTAQAPAAQGVAGAGKVVATQGVAGKATVAKVIAPTLVEIEGAGKLVGLGKGTTAIPTLELTGTLQQGATGGTKVLLTGGEMKVAQAAGTAGAKAAPGAAMVNGGGNGVVMAQGAAGGGNTATVNTLAGTNGNITSVASKAAAASKVPAGTIWTGKGLSLGLGMGLGAWGPVILVALATGGYAYYRKRQAQKFWPF
jgi:hypothetical protein